MPYILIQYFFKKYFNIQFWSNRIVLEFFTVWFVLNQRIALLQVVALCQAPFLLDDPNVGLLFPADAIAKAKHYLSLTTGGLGNLLTCLSYFVLIKKGLKYLR